MEKLQNGNNSFTSVMSVDLRLTIIVYEIINIAMNFIKYE